MTTGTKAREGFDIDLRFGQAREGAFGRILALHGDAIEIKSDQKCRRTRNLFVEIRQKGRPSGLSVTTADYYTFEYDDDCWITIPTKRLKTITRYFATMKNRRVMGGDYNKYEGVLVPVEALLEVRSDDDR